MLFIDIICLCLLIGQIKMLACLGPQRDVLQFVSSGLNVARGITIFTRDLLAIANFLFCIASMLYCIVSGLLSVLVLASWQIDLIIKKYNGGWCLPSHKSRRRDVNERCECGLCRLPVR